MRFLRLGLAIAMLGSLGGIAQGLLPYFMEYRTAGFVIDKGALAHTQPWKSVLIVHALSGLVCLALGILQFSDRVRQQRPRLHRRIGLAFSWALLLLVIPTGFYLALFAFGGFLGTVGFLFNGFLALCFNLLGLQAYRQGHLRDHAAWMTRAFAMAAAAITFRYIHLFLESLGLPHSFEYPISLWGSIAINYALAEYLIARLTVFSNNAQGSELRA